jgi:hypothetical protein
MLRQVGEQYAVAVVEMRAACLNKHKPESFRQWGGEIWQLENKDYEPGDNAKQLNAIRTNVKGYPSSGTERVSRKSQNRSNGCTGKKLEDGYGRVADLKNEIRKMPSCTHVMIRRRLCCWVILIDTLLDSRQEGDSLNESLYNSQRHIKRYSGEWNWRVCRHPMEETCDG